MATETLSATKTVKSFVQEPHQSADYAGRAEESFKAEVDRLVAEDDAERISFGEGGRRGAAPGSSCWD